MSQPAITIGVPLHNGASHLRDCLDCLKNQTFRDFQVLIFENQSTDNSLAIAEEFAKQDSRFLVRPSADLLNVADNFKRAISESAAASRYFLLRAHDDTSNPEFLQILLEALENDDAKKLAVFNVQYLTGGEIRPHEIKINMLDHRSYSTFRRSFSHLRFPASWYYGLFRGADSGALMIDTMEQYPYPWGGDRLLVLKFLFQNQVVFCPGALFSCTLTALSAATYRSKTAREKVRARYGYFKAAYGYIGHQARNGPLGRLAFAYLCAQCARRHTTYTTRRILRQMFRDLVATKK